MAQPLTFTPVEEGPVTFTPVEEPPQGWGARLNATLGTASGKVGDWLRYIDTVGGRLPGTPAGSFVTPGMANPVPRNLTEAGAQLAQAAVPGGNAALRIGAQALGGEVGNQIAGGPTGQGALEGGGSALAGELIGGGLGYVARGLPGAKGRIAAQDAAAYGTEMGRQSPPLAGAQSVQDLRGLAQGAGKAQLGAAKERTVQDIEGLIGGAQTPLSVPALSRDRNLTLREANDLLSEIGARAFSRNPLDRTFQGVDQRKLYGQIASELDAALGAAHPEAPALWQQAQADYKRGLALLRPLQQQNAYRLSPNDVQFNTPAMQRFVQNPRNAALLRNKLGDADYEALVNVLTRGAGQGQDILASGRGGMLDAFRQTFGRGTNSGAAGYLGVPLRTLLPNIGSEYVGRQPYSFPPALQQILDLAVQRGTQEAAR